MLQQKETTEKKSALAEWLNRKQPKQQEASIEALPEDTPTVLSYSQKRLWLLQRLFPENPFYQYGHLYRFKGPLNLEYLQKSFEPISKKYSILRTTFQDTPEGPRQIAGPDQPLEIKIEDLRQLSPNQQSREAEKIIREEVRQTFDLTQRPLLRMKVLQFSNDSFWLILVMHHIIIDRWSLDLVNQEVSRQYLALKNGVPAPITPLPYQYSDYARWQQSLPVAEKDINYWLDKLSGDLASFALPTDFPRPTTPSFKGAMLHTALSPELSGQIRDLSKAGNTTIYVVLLTAFKALLHLYSNQEDILVGSPFSNRDKVSLEEVAGLFNETLVLRTEVRADLSFNQLIEQVKKTTLDGLVHKNVPFETLVQKLNPERLGNYNPLFQVMFSYKTMVPPPDFGADIMVEEETLDGGVAKFDLTLYGLDLFDHITLDLVYASDLYRAATAKRMLAKIEVLLEAVTKTPDLPLGRIPLLSAAEVKEQVITWNDTQAPLPAVSAIHQLMEEQALQFPDRQAVVFQEHQLTYSELNARAKTLAQSLLAKGVKPNTPVGLYCERSVDMMVGIFGILKAGAAYLPLDPDYPAERIAFMLKDSGAPFLIGQSHLLDRLPELADLRVLALEAIVANQEHADLPLPEVSQDQLAYLIYTSGSTGLPKGVPITHLNLIHSTSARFDFYAEQPEAFLLLSSFSFDSSVAGIFWTLCSGGTLVLPQKRIEQDIAQLSTLIQQHGISHTLMLPSLYSLLLTHAENTKLQSLKVIMVAGEACPPTLIEQHFQSLPTAKLYNEYGPTEATVWCIAHQIQREDRAVVPIGKPISNTQVYILNQQLQVVPVGVAGELYIAGTGLASGYLHRPELSRERFITNPFSDDPEERMYKTGDLARYTEQGTIEFLGRADHQIKIRGHRVEPDEIAALLLQFPAVTEAAVIVHRKNDQQVSKLSLVAYCSGVGVDQMDELRQFLKAKLPDYMVPAALIPLDQFPRLPNGKIDRKGLPAPEDGHFSQGSEFVAPSTDLEKQLADIWQEVLGIEAIGVNDNFFEIGGDSILSIQIVAKARAGGITLAANQLFEHQTIAGLSKSIIASDPDQEASLVPFNTKGDKPPLFCVHSGGAHVFFYKGLAQYMASDQPVYALQPKGLDEAVNYHARIEEMAEFYIQEIKKVQPQGPYQLLGTCFSNAVVLEMGNQLHRSGDEVDKLFIIDSGPVHLFGDTTNSKLVTVKRFWDMLKRGDLHRIKSKIISRFTSDNKQQQRLDEVNPEQQFREMIEGLNSAYGKYNWPAYPGKIQFIRSNEFHERKDKKYHLYQWKKLAEGGLEVHVVPGHHLTLFKEPEVQGLAQKISACLEPVNT